MKWDEDRLKKDFKYLVKRIWHHLLLPDPTAIQDDIAEYLQDGPRRLVIEAFRGVGKSWITAAFAIFLLLGDPQLNVMVVSANKDRAAKFSTFVKRLIAEIPEFQHLEPDPEKNQRDSVLAFDVGPSRASQSPSCYAAGIFGQITGDRADVILADDIEVPKNSYTVTMRERLSEAIKEFSSIVKPGDHTRIIYLGTPQTESSIYNLLPDRGFTIRIWPARYPDDEWLQAYEGKVAPKIVENLKSGKVQVGDPVDPERFNEFDLVEREGDYGKTGFNLQFMLDTRMTDDLKFPLKHRDLVVMDLDKEMAPVKYAYGSTPELAWKDLPLVGFTGDRYYRPIKISEGWQEYQGSVMAIDPSGRGKDETGYAVVKMLFGRLFLTASGGFKGGHDKETMAALAKIAQDQKVNKIVIEANFGDGMWTKLFTPILSKYWPCATEEIKSTIMKEARIIDTLEPVMNQHRLVVSPQTIREDANADLQYQLFYQMSRLCRERGALAHDDRLDALSMAVSFWLDQLARDTDDAHKDHEEYLLDKELEKFIESFGGKVSHNAFTVITGR